jgi:alpha-tubulin suppressor-like RCC1 family protein
MDGSVECWGDNSGGELGDGSRISRTTATMTGLSDVTAVAAGEGVDQSKHSCAVKQNGTVLCWGLNSFGELGDGMFTASNIPKEVTDLTNATAIATGTHHACAVKQNGTVVCWGDNSHGQLGAGDVMIAKSTTAVDVKGLTGVTAVTTGDAHACALKQDRTVACWGLNTEGELGDGTFTDRATAVPVAGLNDATFVAAGEWHTCALRQGGAVACWGKNHEGQLGDTTGDTRKTFMNVSDLADAVEIAAGAAYTCAVRQDRTIVCWGGMAFGELGDGTDGGPSGDAIRTSP